MWLGAKNSFWFNNTCLYCRKVLYISDFDHRVTSVRARIQRMREWCEAITWDNSEYRLSLSSVASQVQGLDNIANTGAAIGDVYDSQFTGRVRGLIIKHWWQCMTETYVPNFLDTIEGPIKKSLFSSVLKHNFWSIGFLGVVDFPTPQSPYVAGHLELYREQRPNRMVGSTLVLPMHCFLAIPFHRANTQRYFVTV